MDTYDVSLKIARYRLFMAGITQELIATEEEIAKAMRSQGINCDDIEAIWRLAGADGVQAARSILSVWP